VRKGYRHGHRERQLTGTFGTETVRVPRARVADEAGRVREWRSRALPRYRRLTKKAEAPIAAVHLAGTNTEAASSLRSSTCPTARSGVRRQPRLAQ
jgi:transposase-like protein